MTTVTTVLPRSAARPRLITFTLLLVFVADFAGLTSFYLLLSVVPHYATSAGVGGVGAGLATAALMGSTVAAEFGMPRLVARFGHRAVLAAGLALLGVPALALLVSASMTTIIVVCLLRGVGLAVIFVVCGEMGAALVPAERRGEGLGVLGLVAGLPAVLAMPLGIWLAERAGFAPVFVIGAVTALAGLAVMPGLPRRLAAEERGSEPRRPLGVLTALCTPALLRPSIVFTATAVGAGVFVTFLPAALPHGAGNLAVIALFAQAAAATVSRWWAGKYGDRHGASTLLTPGTVVAALGIATLVLTSSATAVLVGAVLFGAGFGVVQNASLATMYNQVGTAGFGAVTALWSVAYDAGIGLGAAGFGVLLGHTGYGTGFAVTAILVVAVLPVIRRRGEQGNAGLQGCPR